MNSLPAAWIAVGCLLIILLLVISILYVLKAREVAMLKKSVFELRDTMRMMRYEEASLSRMLHTASKPAEQQAAEEECATEEVALETPAVPSTEKPSTDDAAKEGVPTEEQAMEEQTIKEQATEEQATEEPTSENQAIEEPIIEELVTEDTAAPMEETPSPPEAEEETADDEGIEHEEGTEETVATTTTQKQPITGRRPAIPTDLFSAWFAENEDTPAEEENTTETIEEKPIPSQPSPAIVMTTVPQEPTPHIEEEVSPVSEAAKAVETQAATTPATAKETPSVELSKEDERFLRKFERIVNTRMRNPNLNVDTIAAQFGIGRTNFYRKVREVTGVSPNDYLRKCRMERAAELLRTTELTVSDVCVQVGVTDAQYFSKVFKVYFETTPTAYREKHQTIQ